MNLTSLHAQISGSDLNAARQRADLTMQKKDEVPADTNRLRTGRFGVVTGFIWVNVGAEQGRAFQDMARVR